jgi:hypothetical protein
MQRLEAHMPDKPLWLNRIPAALEALTKSSLPWVDRTTVEALLGVRRRRAQQILAALGTEERGRTLVIEKTVLMEHLRRLGAGEVALYEKRRRQRLVELLDQERRRKLEAPTPILVELAPATLKAVHRRDFAGLPPGIELSAGRITVTFTTGKEAWEKLVALALAVTKNQEKFEESVGEGE